MKDKNSLAILSRQHGGDSKSQALDSVFGSRCFARHVIIVSSVERNIRLEEVQSRQKRYEESI